MASVQVKVGLKLYVKTCQIKVILFARSREIAGASSVEIEVAQETSGNCILDVLVHKFPLFVLFIPSRSC